MLEGRPKYMRYVKTKLRFVSAKDSIATRDIETLLARFERLQDEKLQTPIELPPVFEQESLHSTHRLFVSIYCVSGERDKQAQ